MIFQEGEWLCAQCLEYDLVAQAKSLPQLFRALERLIVGHIAVRLRHKQQPYPLEGFGLAVDPAQRKLIPALQYGAATA